MDIRVINCEDVNRIELVYLFFYYWWGGTKSLVLRPLLAWFRIVPNGDCIGNVSCYSRKHS
jgi:hypothetical protein